MDALTEVQPKQIIGVMQPSLRRNGSRSSTMLIIHMFFLSIQEQQKIVQYLDRKTQQIDSLIEKKQKENELLKEQRTSLINQALTKGLNSDEGVGSN